MYTFLPSLSFLPSFPISVEKVAQIDPDFAPANIIICIAAGIKTYKFESLMEVKAYGIGVTGLGLKDYGSSVLGLGHLFGLVHQLFAVALASEGI